VLACANVCWQLQGEAAQATQQQQDPPSMLKAPIKALIKAQQQQLEQKVELN
jgi:hypothetical protein